ncbi:hypothetical protein SCLCIDRAFT_1213056 [Scleroderma citrinum Foug A]|uniref:Uncharacterized protein n=1 Tax=Scleroderma citrinum Foug A TaxID=1036808 RepID=A0A0C3AHZ2_9AGAM|nr:hypothetical protein SCLCIDRAFT_1213056 [Scleroderma citrinum Foug A]
MDRDWVPGCGIDIYESSLGMFGNGLTKWILTTQGEKSPDATFERRSRHRRRSKIIQVAVTKKGSMA